MNTNGPKSSQDPRYNLNEPSRSYGNEPASRPNESNQWPHANEKTTTSSESKPSFNESNKTENDFKKSTTEQLKSTSEQAGEKIKSTFKNLKDSKQVDDLYNYAVGNKEKTITYVLLALGLIILLFVNDLIGGLIIGLLAGYYYSREIVYFIRHLPRFFEGQDQVRYIVLAILLVGLLIEAPGIILGAAVLAAFKQIVHKEREPSNEDLKKSGENNQNHPNK